MPMPTVLDDGLAPNLIWVSNHHTLAWCPGHVADSSGDRFILTDEDGEQFEVDKAEAVPVDPLCLDGVADLLSLQDFNEGALLHNIRTRYLMDEIYTGIGTPILISVNPYKSMDRTLYSAARMREYRGFQSVGQRMVFIKGS